MRDTSTPLGDSTPTPERRREVPQTQHGGSLPSIGGRMNVDVFDGRSNYKFWERRMKSALRAMGLGNALRLEERVTPPAVWISI